jgi:type IV secretory pathway VirD2 relaxase
MDPFQTIHADSPVFRPRIGGGRRPTSRSGGANFRNAVLSAASCWSRGARQRATTRARLAMLPPAANARRVIIKTHVQRMVAGAAKAAALHLRYIERDGVEKDGSKGMLYGADGPASAASFLQPRLGEKHQFRIIVSPEDGGDLDLTQYVRRLVSTVERDLGRKLEWAAVNHYDTDHPHAHLVIRGVDQEGRELRLDRAYISRGLRWRAQELATQELGPRHEFEIRRAYVKEVDQERFTSLDREIERRVQDGRVDARSPAPRGGPIDNSTLLARLEHLEGLGLAERVAPVSWKLAEGWKDRLSELGTRGDILKQIHNAISGDPARYHIVRPGQDLSDEGSGSRVLTGRVASKGLSDELKGRFYAVIETPEGAAYHLPLTSRGAEELRPGDIVSFMTKPETALRPMDRQIADIARAQGGVYSLEQTADGNAHPHERRLRELARLGLATSEAPGRWKVSPNLLRELEQRRPEAPVRHRLLLHKQPLSLESQVRHPGLVWLDRLKTDSLAPYGLGAELRRAIEQRRDALRQLGVQPDDPKPIAKLREVERRAVGKDIAARSGQVFVPGAPERFRGQVQLASAPAHGRPYVIVSDGSRFVVLHATASLRAAQGKDVTVGRDAKGRLLVRPAADRDPRI